MSAAEIRAGLFEALGKLGERKRVLAVPPDFTRFHSKAGELTEMAWEFYGDALMDVLPALGTHTAMTDGQIATMFGETPRELFRVHDWRNDIVTLGEVPGEFVREVSEGKVEYSWPAQVNKLLRDGGHDLILSIGQVVPHEVVGMANGIEEYFYWDGWGDGDSSLALSGRGVWDGADDGAGGYSGAAGAELCERALWEAAAADCVCADGGE